MCCIGQSDITPEPLSIVTIWRHYQVQNNKRRYWLVRNGDSIENKHAHSLFVFPLFFIRSDDWTVFTAELYYDFVVRGKKNNNNKVYLPPYSKHLIIIIVNIFCLVLCFRDPVFSKSVQCCIWLSELIQVCLWSHQKESTNQKFN